MCIQLTEPAVLRLRSLLRSQNLGPSAGVRIRIDDGGCAGLSYDMKLVARAEPEDRSFESGGVALFVEPASLASLRGVQLDFVEGVMESGFRFSNPSATSTCGCGKSFSTTETCAPERASCHGN